ncbi:thioesterase family protein [Aurantimonas sp. Leaf443]|uniref:thioesterase family protein n=1 Tax=Aurantimonas sp. Leaf443 TaxID=1736378 RepID=UPI000B0EBCF0|nr:thioesterase family protein [Aurantimonas sp. Leaf443]
MDEPTIETSGFVSAPMEIEPQWIDHNGHLNLAYYHVLFDRGVDELFERFGIGPHRAAESSATTFAAESHVVYRREVKPGSIVRVASQIIAFDERRIHVFQRLFHAEGWCAATLEGLILSVDLSGPKVAPFPPDIAGRLAAVAAEHAHLPRPEDAGRAIAMRPKRAP